MREQEQCIPLSVMSAMINAGTAVPLLDSSAPPVRYAGQWWAIPLAAHGNEYEPVRDAHAVAVLDDSVRRLARAVAR